MLKNQENKEIIQKNLIWKSKTGKKALIINNQKFEFKTINKIRKLVNIFWGNIF